MVTEQDRAQLRELFTSLNVQEQFSVGDIVIWKKGMRTKRLPEEGEPTIVMEVLDEPVIDMEATVSSPYYRERLDLKLGVIDTSGDFCEFLYDSRRFTKV